MEDQLQFYPPFNMIIRGEFDKEENTYQIVFIFYDKDEVVNFLKKLDSLEII